MAEMKVQVQEVLDTIRPALQADGGDVELVNITDDNVVELRLQGHCKGCPMSQMTLALVIERTLKEKLPVIAGVVAVE
jgi:Fe-S cluster biogenesis protein NfuA